MSAEIVAILGNVNPHVVADSLRRKLETGEVKELYVVALAHDGDPTIWTTSGTLAELCYAARALGVVADRYIRGEVEDV